MLTLQLTLNNQQVTVNVNGKDSHQFSLASLNWPQTKVEIETFVSKPSDVGAKLFQVLFKEGSDARTSFDALSKQAERIIILVLESSELDGIAWEYAYHDNAYIVEDFAFMRALPEKERTHANGRLSKSVERVPLLFIPANPLVVLDKNGNLMPQLNLEAERDEMFRLIKKSNAPFDLWEMLPATPKKLQEVMAQFHDGLIVHFTGHGGVNNGRAMLLFEEENGASNPIDAQEFVREVKDQAWIGFLSACQSAVAERTEYSNLARELVKAGVPFALGMQFNLPDSFAPNISGQFYNYLAQGHAVPEAARQARRAVKRENEFYVGMIALYAAHPDEIGKTEWTGSGARILSTFAAADVSDLPTPSGFIGRQRELMNIGTELLAKKKTNTVTLHGAGGIGKTALLGQALMCFAPSFESTLAIALDPLPSLESVLGRLERFLNLSSPCSNDTKERERIVRGKLTDRETLLGLDNFETLIHARDNGSDEEKKTAKSLYAFCKSLAAEGVTLCVTSREKTSLPGETIQEIHGLEDEVGGRLFQNTVSTRRDALTEEGVKKISAAVGGHPLALHLLAPIFEEQAGLTLDDFVQKLGTFLPKAHDEWTEQGRHESLGACFAFSMDNLPKNEGGEKIKVAISRLSIFIAYFLDITATPVLENHFPESEEENNQAITRTQTMLHILWQRGLLERIAIQTEEENFYFYRLHPVVNQFAAVYVAPDYRDILKNNYINAMQKLVILAYPEGANSGIYGVPFLATIFRIVLPDILKALSLVNSEDTDTSFLLYTAFIQSHFGNIEEAMGKYKEALEKFDQLNDLHGKVIALIQIAGVYGTQNSLEKAMSYYKQALEICEKTGEEEGKANILFEIANIDVIRGNLVIAKKYLDDALKINEKSGNQRGKAAILHDLAWIHTIQGNTNDAMKCYQQSLAINEMLGDLKGKATTLHDMAHIFIDSGDLEQAMKLSKQSLDISESLEDLKGISDALFQTANIHKNRNNLNEANKLYKQSLGYYETLGDLKGVSDALYNLADISHTHRDYKQAISMCQQSIQLKEELGDLQGIALTLVMLSHNLWDSKKYKEAIGSHFKGLTMLLELNIQPEVQKKIISDLIVWRNKLGTEKFDVFWVEETAQPTPKWLTQSPLISSQPSFVEKRSTNKKHRKRIKPSKK